MRLVPPQKLTLISSSVTESAYSEYAAGTTYALGDKVYVTLEADGVTDRTPHKIYESLVATNTGNYPPDNADKWLDCGATNRWAMFDVLVSSQTSDTGPIEVSVTPETIIDTITLFALEGTTVEITCASAAAGVIYNEIFDLQTTIISDWYDYFFAADTWRGTIIATIPTGYTDLTVTATINGATAKCGMLAMGRSSELGSTLYAPTIGITDYSTKKTNEFGETEFVERAYSKTASATIQLPSGQLDNLAAILSSVRATPAVWDFNNQGIAETDYERLIVFGFFNDFDILLQNYVTTTLSLNIEGLI